MPRMNSTVLSIYNNNTDTEDIILVLMSNADDIMECCL